MKIRKRLFFGLLLFFALSGTSTHYVESAAEASDGLKERDELKRDLIELEKNVKSFSLIFEKVAQLVGPSVVKINVTKNTEKGVSDRRHGNGLPFRHPFPLPRNNPFGGDAKPPRPPGRTDDPSKTEIGSGVFIRENGYILTNFHVIQSHADGEVNVILYNGERYKADVIGVDPKTDLAVLKVDGKGFQETGFADISETRVGDWVIAIGSPFNYQQTVSAGIVSAVGRKNVSPATGPFAYSDFIQTDTAINPGSSGGPLVNLRGEIVGINTAITTNSGSFQGIAFAISSSIAEKVADDLIRNGMVSRGHIGVGMLNIDDKLAEMLELEDSGELLEYLGLSSRNGAFVARVWNNTPADHAGIQTADVVIEMDGKAIVNSERMQKVIREIDVGSTVNMVIVRRRKRISIDIKIGEQPENMNGIQFLSIRQGSLRVGFGLTVQRLDPKTAEKRGYKPGSGIMVTDVDDGSIAATAGITRGDIISKAGGNDMPTVFELYRTLSANLEQDRPVTLRLHSKGFVTLIPDD